MKNLLNQSLGQIVISLGIVIMFFPVNALADEFPSRREIIRTMDASILEEAKQKELAGDWSASRRDDHVLLSRVNKNGTVTYVYGKSYDLLEDGRIEVTGEPSIVRSDGLYHVSRRFQLVGSKIKFADEGKYLTFTPFLPEDELGEK